MAAAPALANCGGSKADFSETDFAGSYPVKNQAIQGLSYKEAAKEYKHVSAKSNGTFFCDTTRCVQQSKGFPVRGVHPEYENRAGTG